MKKLVSESKYKKRNRAHAERLHKRNLTHKRKTKNRRKSFQKQRHVPSNKRIRKPPIVVPTDFRLMHNTDECLKFFNEIRSEQNASQITPLHKVIFLEMEGVENIDYASISLLIAISNHQRDKGITFWGTFPKNKECRNFFEDSGFLDYMKDQNGNPFKKAEMAEHIKIQTEKGRFSVEERKKMSLLFKKASQNLTGDVIRLHRLSTLFTEICGNSVEWSSARGKMRLVGMYMEEESVTFTAIDLGRGIISTIRRKFTHKLQEIFIVNKPVRILENAFNMKYGSSTGEINRAKGLVSVKTAYDERKIVNLCVITNNVILDFDDNRRSRKLKYPFHGTMYQWKITRECIENMVNDKNS